MTSTITSHQSSIITAHHLATPLAPLAPPGGTGEDALLDLERAREESGVLRWALLRQILADLRARMAEMASSLSESKHQTALLEQSLGLVDDVSREI